jgi:branched-chain amino acid transport system permease protein
LLLTVVVMIVGALLIERLVLRPLVNRSQITLFMATLGLSFIIEGLAQGLMGRRCGRWIWASRTCRCSSAG